MLRTLKSTSGAFGTQQRAALVAAAARAFSSSASAASSPLVLYEEKGNVGLLTLNNPKKLNMLTVPMSEDLGNALSQINTEKVGALVITGAGTAFSAGGDLDFLRDRTNDTGSRNSNIMRDFYQRYLRIRQLPIPTIAAINGPAIGAGLCFALGCDLRLASKNAKLGVTFVGLGLHPGMGATYNLPRLIGPQLAAKMCLTGEVISGEEAARIGLVLSAEEESQVVAKALELGEKIAAQGPIAVRSCMRSLRIQQDQGLDQALWREADAQSYCYSHQDMKEGIEAVANKKKPSFKGNEQYKS